MPKNIPFLASPHFNQRPSDVTVDMIVLHAISLPDGAFTLEYISDLFLGKLNSNTHSSFKDLEGVKVSSHFVVDRDGNVTQFVKTHHRAWHAGDSTWLGCDNCNNYAIGIEMIGDERKPFTKRQYQQTARLCKNLMRLYPLINPTRIVGHQDIAPSRKWDPGKQWDWARFSKYLGASSGLRAKVKV
ncbi:MAG: 1,6-anhydro-N-acetylmuramyl-L-alanine amidase AmpD [Ghiorsea sp.]